MKNYNVKIPEDTINQIIIDYKSKSNQIEDLKQTVENGNIKSVNRDNGLKQGVIGGNKIWKYNL